MLRLGSEPVLGQGALFKKPKHNMEPKSREWFVPQTVRCSNVRAPAFLGGCGVKGMNMRIRSNGV